VEHLSRRSAKASKPFETLVAKLGPIRLERARPDGEPFKVVQPALLTCAATSGCVLILDLPGLGRLAREEKGSIRIVRLDPEDGATVVRGEPVTVKATVRYELKGEYGMISLFLQDQAGKALLEPRPPGR